MQIKDFKVMVRKILDTQGYESVAIRFQTNYFSGAWVTFPRTETSSWTYEDGKRVPYHKPEEAEYSSITFHPGYIRLGSMAQILKILYHEIAHLNRGSAPCADYRAQGKWEFEMDEIHDIKWMREMWKFGYEGKPRFDKDLIDLQSKVNNPVFIVLPTPESTLKFEVDK